VLQNCSKNHVIEVLEAYGKINLGVRKNIFMTRGVAKLFSKSCF
jgi:hypothetical protein